MGVVARTNPVLKALTLAALAGAVAVVVRACTRDEPSRAPLTLERIEPVPRSTLGAEGDTEEETLRTLIAEVRRLHEDYATLEADNQTLREQNTRFERMEDRLARQLEEELQTTSARLERESAEVERRGEDAEGLLALLEQRLAEFDSSGGPGSDIPVGLGYDASLPNDAVRWVEPLDAPAPGQNDGGFPARLESLVNPVAREGRGSTGNPGVAPRVPVLTVPRNSTLVGARGFTALIGRIPVRGQVVDPFPFKILVGQENLAANGFVMPELFGMVFSGRAVGDWTLSCVRGEIFSVTYVLQDGSIQSYPEGNIQDEALQPIGWISDPYGVPCVPGERKSDAQRFLSQRIGLSAAAAAAQAAAAAETATTLSGVTGTATTTVTGDIDRFVRNRTASQSIEEVSRWLGERQEQSFDAIYVPPDHELVVHVTRELPIDFDPQGRKVNHHVESSTRFRALD